ncbi:aspartyl-phosphate phosphatase Spo0E family protein [Halobacillus sp. Marseille-P3879]|nr:aspartyl-phosphate phosphatase Spo0E family protein [Halobacillus sp. Marseille-P3879]
MNDLEEQVELLRTVMQDIYLENPQDPRLVKISQSLDELLNELDRQREIG